MKKYLCLLLALLMAFALFGCAESEGVKAETSQSTSETSPVDTTEQTLVASEEAMQEQFVGKWIDVGSYCKGILTTMTLGEDGMGVWAEPDIGDPIRFAWKIIDGTIPLGFTTADAVIHEIENDITYLTITEEYDTATHVYTLVKEEDLGKIIEVVDLTIDNVGNYIEFVDVPYQEVDDSGEVKKEGSAVWLASKVYDQGLLYVNDDPKMNVVIKTNCVKAGLVNGLSAFGPLGGSIFDQEIAARSYSIAPTSWSASNCSFSEVSGRIYFVRSEYANLIEEDGIYSLEILGTEVADQWWREAEPDYVVLEGKYLQY